MIRGQDKFHESGLAARAENIRAAAGRFDAVTLAAAESIREGEKRFHEAAEGSAGDAERRSAEAMYDSASALAPHAPGLVALLSNLDHLPYSIQSALPELINDTNIARITGALRFIDNELNNLLC
jgi:hypothetical protein